MATGRADGSHRLTAVAASVAAQQLHSLGEERHESGENLKVIRSIASRHYLGTLCISIYSPTHVIL